MVEGRKIKMKKFFLFLILFFLFQKSTLSENILTEYLVAKPNMQDPRFKETVIVLLFHNQQEGAAGLVINKPIEKISINELFKENNFILSKKYLNMK